MIVKCIFDATVLTKKANESKTERGKIFYKIGVIKEDELGELSCSEDVYNNAVKGKPYRLHCAFNTMYNSFSVADCESLEDLYAASKQAADSEKAPKADKSAK